MGVRRLLTYQLNLFGRFALTGPDGADIVVRSAKGRALLAYLALSPGRARSRDQIIALLWSDRAEAQARASLRQALASLRKDLGAAGDILKSDNETVALAEGAVEIAGAEGGRLLDGLHLRDPAFEDWLRDERLRCAQGVRTEDRTADVATKPSIVVMPFDNLSADPDQTYFSEGITEDIATELSRFGLINVLARKTVFDLQERADSSSAPGGPIRSDYRLTGSLRKLGNRIRLSAHLIDCRRQTQVWADRFDRELDDIFAIQDELVRAIVTQLIGRIEMHRTERAIRKPAHDLAAYDYYLQGLWYDRRYSKEALLAGRGVLKKAIARDPLFARAYGLLSTIMMCINWFDHPTGDDPDEILACAKKAVELDPFDGDCFSKLGAIHLDRKETEAAERAFDTAMRLSPNDPYLWSHYAWLQNVLSRLATGLEWLDQAMASDPHPPKWALHIRAESLFGLRRFEEAAALLEALDLADFNMLGQLAACYAHLGEAQKASDFWARHLALRPKAKIGDVGAFIGYVDPADTAFLTEGLRKAGLGD